MTSEEFRSHFPIFQDKAHLCSCSEGALSDRVVAAMSEFLTQWRRDGAPWQAWMGEVERSRRLFAQLIGAKANEVAIVSCASEGAYHVASSLPFTSRDGLVASDMEFPSIAHVWLGQAPRGARVRFAHGDARPDLAAFLAEMDERTALVSVPLAGYRDGYRPPVREVVEAAHSAGALAFVDAYQAAGVLSVDVKDLGCDFLVAGALKYLLGAPGLAFLYVREGLVEQLQPPLTGWFARKEPFAFDPRLLDFAGDARRFQTGTPAIPAAYAAAAGLSLVLELDQTEVEAHVRRLAERLEARLLAAGAELYSPREAGLRGPQVAVRSERADSLGSFLAQRGVIGAPRGEALRLSLHYYNSQEDVDRAADAVLEFMQSPV